MFNNNVKLLEDIKVFNIQDETALKVIDFYTNDPFPNYEGEEDKLSILSKGDKNQYTHSLKKFIGYGKQVLEVGAGTSQLANYLSIGNNNLLVAFDANFNSLKLGKAFSKANKINNVEFVCGDIFDDIFKENFFDLVLCNGVLHHTKNSQKAFEKSLKWLKKDGYIIVGLYNKIGRIRTMIRKYLSKILGKKYLMFFDPILRNLDKKSKKKIDAWINDQYIHPVERSHTFDDVLRWFQENNVEFINSYPKSEMFTDDNNENIFENFFKKGKQGNFLERILSQIIMIFSRPGSEGGLFLFIGKKR